MADKDSRVIRVGSRASQLAMIQTHTIIDHLQKLHPSITFEVITMKTIGDQVLDKPLPNIGQTNLFTKELETALAVGQIDLIVHSLKDLPTTLPPGMQLAVIYKRDSPTDTLILAPQHKGKTINDLPSGSVIGTSSLRRIAQLKRHFPNYQYKPVRGNLNTRLTKLDTSGEYDGLILASAGIERMGWKDRISQELDSNLCLYAVGQGALAVETRSDDQLTLGIVSPLNDPETLLCCSAERKFLQVLGGGCSVPVGVQSKMEKGEFVLVGGVFSLDGSEVVQGEVGKELPSEYPSLDVCKVFGEKIGEELARDLLTRGAKEVLDKARKETDIVTAQLTGSSS